MCFGLSVHTLTFKPQRKYTCTREHNFGRLGVVGGLSPLELNYSPSPPQIMYLKVLFIYLEVVIFAQNSQGNFLSNCESRLQITCKKFCFPTYCLFVFVFESAPPPPTAESVGFIIYDMRSSQGPKLTFFVYLPIASKLRTFNDQSYFLLALYFA